MEQTSCIRTRTHHAASPRGALLPERRRPRAFVCALAFLSLLGAVRLPSANAAGPTPEFVTQMNLGKAFLENRNSAQAIPAFEAAVRLEPRSAPARRNLARALLLADQNDAAFEHLARAQELEKDSAATAYLQGLVRVHQTRFEEAIPFLETAVRLDPNTPALRFQLGNALLLARHPDRAVVQFRETLRLDPLHASAHFRLASHALQSENTAEFQKHQAEYNRLRRLFPEDTRTPTALERCLYTQPEPALTETAPPPPAIVVRFSEASAQAFAPGHDRATAVAVLEVPDSGACRLIVVDERGTLALLHAAPSRPFTRTPVGQATANAGPFLQAAVGDFHNDVPPGTKFDPAEHARNDVLLVGANGLCLLQQTNAGSFADVTASAGLAGVRARRAQWVDYDHDGDLDLALAGEAGLNLWQNNGNGRFTNVTEHVGLTDTRPAVDVALLDLDGNGAVDLAVAQGTAASRLWLNQRAGRFARMAEPPGPWPGARRVLADDLDNDGRADALLLGDKAAVAVFGRRAGRRELDLGTLREPTGALLDFDNDGWLDFCAAGVRADATNQGALRLWRGLGAAQWQDVSETAALDRLTLPAVRDLIAGDLDGDGDTDLLAVSATHRLHFLRNDGGHAQRQLKLRLVGLKTNPTGLGTHIEARAGDFFAARLVSRLPVEIGLGPRTRLDSLQTVWGNGVVDNQVHLAVPGPPVTLAEKNVAAGSCPYLYAWDGHGFRFVTDLLGNAPLGLSIQRGVVLPADPDEIVFVGTARDFPPRDGFHELEVTDELREVLYLDEARLIVVDHAPEVEVHSTDKLGPPPFPPSELWGLTARRAPRQAVGDDGLDRTAAVQTTDGVMAPPGTPLPPPLRGLCQPLALTLDFGPLDPARPLVLALTGWIQYGDASVNIAASQNPSLTIIPPTLEAETAGGTWAPVDVVVGMPAGKTKTIVCDLARKLPAGTRRLRLTTSFELRWDRIALFERADAAPWSRRTLPPADAQLFWRGFSEIKSRAPGHPQTPAHEVVRARPPWRTTPQGWCTRYGDVLDLVRARDARLAVLNGGDALRLRFDARALPPVPPGRERSFFFFCVGWDKDEDYNVEDGHTVGPLPVGEGADWTLELNTRWVAADRFTH